WNCGPDGADDIDPVPLLCLDPDSAFSNKYYPQVDPKKAAQGKVKASERLFDCPQWHLYLDTETIHSKRWSAVPGSKWINYTRPSERVRQSLGLADPIRAQTRRGISWKDPFCHLSARPCRWPKPRDAT